MERAAVKAGRIKKPIALAIKARVLVYAASPLFNGNPDYAGFLGYDGEPLFSAQYSEEKWKKAADACKEAIEMCHDTGHELFYMEPNKHALTDTKIAKIKQHHNVKEKWNH